MGKLNRRPGSPGTCENPLNPFENIFLGGGLDQNVERALRERFQRENPEEALAQQLLAYQRNPMLFLQNELGLYSEIWPNDMPPPEWKGYKLPIWSKQREVLKALVKHKKVAVKAGHGVGKTFSAALAVLYITYVYKALGVTTAPGFRQVRRLLWGEIHKLYNRAPKKLGGKLTQTALELGDKWFVEGFSVENPETQFTGFHEATVFGVVDEAGGVVEEVFAMLDTILTSADSYVLLIGNPIDNASPFFDYFKPDSGFHNITISAWDSPNVKHGRVIYPQLVAPDWPERMRQKWGEDDPWYYSRVLGEFPPENAKVLFPQRYLELAFQRELEEDHAKCLACDVSLGGGDRTVVGLRWKSGKFRILETCSKNTLPELEGMLKDYYRTYEKFQQDDTFHRLFINVDELGCGGGLADSLADSGIPANAVVSSENPDPLDYDGLDEDDVTDMERFLNLRAYAYWRLSLAFADGTADIDDDELYRELSKVERGYTKDKIKTLEKEEIKKRLKGRSPDKADTMMIAWAKDTADMQGDLVRFI